jgi:rhodanese-related sulfurtransferase
MKTVTPQQLKVMLHDGEEIAVVDVREQGVFSKGHLLLACSIPLSHLELKLRDLVPRQSTRIVLVDDGPSDKLHLAGKAAERLDCFGYSNIAVLADGIEGWRDAGYELFSGINVPSKAFGEFVEITYDTPRLSAEELKAKVDAGEKLVILDSRPKDEYHCMNIPGGINVPGAELVYRVHDVAPDPETLVVVNCAGRTRSIIGAQSLINAAISNPVAALKNGTMGWELAGFDLEHGKERNSLPPTPGGLEKAKTCAARVAKRFGVKGVDWKTLERWGVEADKRTLYVLDVRLPEEYEGGHLEGARNAPGGQLVQAADKYMAVRGARVILVDDTEVRATMTASWLIQMGWTETYVLAGGIGSKPLPQGSHRPVILGFEKCPSLSTAELKSMIDSGESVAVIDLATSVEYRNRHIPGAWWAVRSRLESDLQNIPQVGLLVLTSPEGTLAYLAAKEAKALRPDVGVRVLEGGTRSWIDADFPTTKGMEHFISEADDVWYKPYDYNKDPKQAMRDYLTWEVGLIEQIERDGDVEFKAFT